MPAPKPIFALFLAAPFLISGCQSGGGSGGSTATIAAPTPATTVATSGALGTVSNPFPENISGGDGFQVVPANDASFATLINTVRVNAGQAPVSYNANLNTAAQDYAADMLAKNYFGHFGKDGTSDAMSRAIAAGYTSPTYIAENIAQGQKNENAVMNAWVASAPHQRNNIDPRAKEFGLGRAGTGSDVRWVLMLGAR